MILIIFWMGTTDNDVVVVETHILGMIHLD